MVIFPPKLVEKNHYLLRVIFVTSFSFSQFNLLNFNGLELNLLDKDGIFQIHHNDSLLNTKDFEMGNTLFELLLLCKLYYYTSIDESGMACLCLDLLLFYSGTLLLLTWIFLSFGTCIELWNFELWKCGLHIVLCFA